MITFSYILFGFLLHFITTVCTSHHGHKHGKTHPSSLGVETNTTAFTGPSFARSLPAGMCSVDEPCQDGSCCNGNSGFCGLDPDHCSSAVCISNCKAKAECGVGAETLGAECPLKVCCGKWGYCGTSDSFCKSGCQSNCNPPSPTGQNRGDVRKLVIGYFEGWSLTRRGCAGRTIDDIPVDSLSHLNLAFAYIQPKTFEIVPMDKMSDKTFSQITNLKQKAPGLKIWISLGGWTFSDNGTDTQPVWGDIASSVTNRAKFIGNLYRFMETWGFDGVDIDWEYPGAPDRGGSPTDPDNFVLLLEQMSLLFQAGGSKFGISFTAPTSYWYLRWFKIGELYKYVDFINLMTYDIHGSWDSPADQIGSFVYAHTNLTEIKDALGLFWRNNVPMNRVNLGIGFYGRSYTLKDPACNKPGCPFKDVGVAGQCTGQGGVMSFAEIEGYIKQYSLTTEYDQEAQAKYLAFNENQWVSYDDKETLQKKVDFANEQGLLGLFIWAIDLDDREHSALQALLGGKLGTFSQQNGYDPTFGENGTWEGATGNSCGWTSCGSDKCSAGTRSAGAEQYCGVDGDGKAKRQTLCCPLKSTPSPDTCDWAGDGGGFECSAACPDGSIPIASSQEPYIQGSHKSCFLGVAQYCCKGKSSLSEVCGWTSSCTKLSKGKPKDTSVCGARNIVTTKRDTCKSDSGKVYCCDKGVDTSSCYWNEGKMRFPEGACSYSESCADGEIRIALDKYGGSDKNGDTHTCQYPIPQQQGIWQWPNADLAFCCNANGMGQDTINLPVPLVDLFPSVGPDSNTEKLDIKLDKTMGGNRDAPNSNNPDDNAFGFYIMSGPQQELTTVSKRDGSHWEIFDCDNTAGEKRQTVKMVCTDTSANSNCGIIFEGRGVAHTVVDMPGDCGPGRYAVAVSLEPSASHEHLKPHLVKRGLESAPVYDFTFDYDFSVFEKRADKSNVLLRIDYSDDPGYWSDIVLAHHNKRKRDLEVQFDFGGDEKAWLYHTWHKEKRSMTHEELHARWWSGNVREWYDRQRNIDHDYTGIRHRVVDTRDITLFDETLNCPSWPGATLYFSSWAELNIDIETAAGVTVIGTLGNLQSFNESSAWFRTKGRVDASLHFRAKGDLSFHTGQLELFGAHNFGASFRVPGIVTIGPDFRILGSLAGDATLQMKADYGVNLANWDYSMRFPVPEGESLDPKKEADISEPKVNKTNDDPYCEGGCWEVDAKGQLVAHITPKVTFGIVFDSSRISNAALDLGVDAYTRLYADAKVGSSQDFVYCYGADAGATLFASVEAPTVFKIPLSRYWSLWSKTFDVVPKKCSDGST
ncbi:hypothetical protein BCR34DRAFT_572769 [Clohesyomyces aquaticus]|uniref:chitinase n=1 Tax=Clohesyomyces aquaticus TaxID=1231657 RepID=A0A1Y1Z275_9PLEO|nr:hypothetical protein BCR34DRAFT_572769 [Clohesyomyces aquaticus]